MDKQKKNFLSITELNSIVADATSKASERMRSNSETVITVKGGALVEEHKDGTIRVIRKVSSRKVVPGTKISIRQ